MQQTRFWKLFVLTFAGIFCLTGGRASYQVMQYYKISVSAPAEDVRWAMVALNKDAYTLQALYSFQVGEQVVKGTWQLRNLRVRSSIGAEAALDRAVAASWTVWYDPNHPNKSQLEHTFPYKLCIYTGMMGFALGYLCIASWMFSKPRCNI